MHNQEYCIGEWEISGASHCGKGGRPASYQSHEPCSEQYNPPLVRISNKSIHFALAHLQQIKRISICDHFATGMEFDSFEADGLMDRHIYHNAPFKQGRAMFTISPLLGREVHSGGMHT